MTHREWIFTAWEEPTFSEDTMKYIIYGKEKCPTTDKLHYQGFVAFKKQKRLKGVKKILGDQTHIEPRRGTAEQAINYCKKDGDWQEHGVYEIMNIGDIVRQNITYIKEKYPLLYCRYYKGIERLQDKGPAWRTLIVKYIWGKPGTGKTRMAMNSSNNIFKIDPPYKWWDGYEGEDTIIIDDYEELAIPRAYLLNLLDGYRLRLETKGSHTWARWQTVYITSNYKPPEDIAIKRRITEIIHLE